MPVITPTRSRGIGSRGGMTMVELLLALAIGVLVVALVGSLYHTVFTTRNHQRASGAGLFAARAALRGMGRDIAAACVPAAQPDAAFHLTRGKKTGDPIWTLAFCMPDLAAQGDADWYELQRVTYRYFEEGVQEARLTRHTQPLVGPGTETPPATNLLLRGSFKLQIQAWEEGQLYDEWPPQEDAAPMPQAMHATLEWPDTPAMSTEVLIECANPVFPSPKEAPEAEPQVQSPSSVTPPPER